MLKNNKMKKRRRFTKRTAAVVLTAMMVAAGCMSTASAAVQSWTHTISCAATGSTSFVFNANYKGTRSDCFASYPTIYNGKDRTEGNCQVKRGSTVYNKQPYCLYANQASRPTYYFGQVPAGSSVHYYDNTYGGFKSSLTTNQTY